MAMIDANGTQVVEYHYDAWGNPVAKTGSMVATLGTVNPFRYCGYVYDEETGLYYLRSRYYNPAWKRFMNADALVSTGKGLPGKNMFAYCNNCPTRESDPTGQSAINLAIVLVTAAFSLSGCSAKKKTPPRDYSHSESGNQNCYGYAFGFINNNTNPGDYALRRSQPSTIEKEYHTVDQVAALVEADMQVRGQKVRIIDSPDEAQNDEYVVALKTTTSSFFDYHFARQLGDGTWADKQGSAPSRWDGLNGNALVWDGPFFIKYDSDTVYFAVKGD